SAGGVGVAATILGDNTHADTTAVEVVLSGGRVSQTTVLSGSFLIVSAGGVAVATTVIDTDFGFDHGAFLVDSGGSASGTVISSGGQEGVFSGGVDRGGTVKSGGLLDVLGGTVSGATVSGLLLVSSGVVVSANLKSGGTEIIDSGGSDVGT